MTNKIYKVKSCFSYAARPDIFQSFPSLYLMKKEKTLHKLLPHNTQAKDESKRKILDNIYKFKAGYQNFRMYSPDISQKR